MSPVVADTQANTERAIPGLGPTLKRRLRAMFRLLGTISPALSARLALRLFSMPRARPVSSQDDEFLSGASSRRLASASGDVQLYEWPAAGPAVLAQISKNDGPIFNLCIVEDGAQIEP